MVTSYDVAVAGGGPAGAFAARELTRAGLSTVLIDPATSRPRLEGLGERVTQLLAQKGFEQALDTVSERVRRSVAWAGLQNSENGERLVRRHEFDEALRRAAIAAGSSFIGARVRRIETSGQSTGVRLELSNGNSISARLLVDARGRQAPARHRRKGPQTLAIAGLVCRTAEASRTHVEASPEGWLWSAKAPGFGHWIQISVDADTLRGTGADALGGRMRRFLNQPQFAGRFDSADFNEGLIARNAGLVLAAPVLRGPVVPVGDAAIALDPLSGHGIFWALSSALSAVPGVLTVLEDPATGPGLAARFYSNRVVETFWRQARVGRDFYALEKKLAHHPFWARRAGWPDSEPSHPVEGNIRLERRVVVDNGRLRERDVLIAPRHPEGIAFLAGVPVSDLTPFIRGERRADASENAASPALAEALRWLDSHGILNRFGNQAEETRSRMRETA